MLVPAVPGCLAHWRVRRPAQNIRGHRRQHSSGGKAFARRGRAWLRHRGFCERLPCPIRNPGSALTGRFMLAVSVPGGKVGVIPDGDLRLGSTVRDRAAPQTHATDPGRRRGRDEDDPRYAGCWAGNIRAITPWLGGVPESPASDDVGYARAPHLRRPGLPVRCAGAPRGPRRHWLGLPRQHGREGGSGSLVPGPALVRAAHCAGLLGL
jgi:hypothetical protein